MRLITAWIMRWACSRLLRRMHRLADRHIDALERGDHFAAARHRAALMELDQRLERNLDSWEDAIRRHWGART